MRAADVMRIAVSGRYRWSRSIFYVMQLAIDAAHLHAHAGARPQAGAQLALQHNPAT
jgi:hypothetical protein